MGPQPFNDLVAGDGAVAVGDQDFEKLASLAAGPGRSEYRLAVTPDVQGAQKVDPQLAHDAPQLAV
jgi:hypothetical protein